MRCRLSNVYYFWNLVTLSLPVFHAVYLHNVHVRIYREISWASKIRWRNMRKKPPQTGVCQADMKEKPLVEVTSIWLSHYLDVLNFFSVWSFGFSNCHSCVDLWSKQLYGLNKWQQRSLSIFVYCEMLAVNLENICSETTYLYVISSHKCCMSRIQPEFNRHLS